MPTMIDASKNVALWLVVTVGIAMVLGGGLLIYLGATGDSQIRLFGRAFSYEVVGAAALVCGAVVAFLGLRRGFHSLDSLVSKGKVGAD